MTGQPRPLTEDERNMHERVAFALRPFVHRWGLSLNPEEIDEIAYAVVALTAGEPSGVAERVEAHLDLVDEINQRHRANMVQQMAEQERARRERPRHIGVGVHRLACGVPTPGQNWVLAGFERNEDVLCSDCVAALSARGGR